jgi:dipeptidyl aminopeptidase/acylaminoacyl peptidase
MEHSMHRLIIAGLAVAVLAAAPVAGQRPKRRPFDINDLGRVRQPFLTTVSPDGNMVAYVLGDSLWVRDLRGGAARALTDSMLNQVAYQRPAIAWAPGSDRLLVRRGAGGPTRSGTFVVVDVRNSTGRPLLPYSLNLRLQTFMHWAMGAPSWSPDGGRIAFVATHQSSPTQVKLFVTDVATGNTALWASDTLPFGGLVSASWSPDGTWLAFTSGAFSGDAGRVSLLSASSGVPHQERVLLRGGSPMYRDPSWSYDSHYLAVTAHNDRKFVLELNADSTRVITPKLKLSSYRAWLPNENALLGTVRSGMSSRLAKENPVTGELVMLSGKDTLFSPVGPTTNGIAVIAETGSLPRDIWVRERNGKSHRVTNVNAWADSIALPRANIYRWLSATGDTLEAQLFLPPNTPRNARVPLVVMPYGSYSNEFPKSEYFLSAGIPLLAAHGFGVVLPNTRDVGIQGEKPGYGHVQLEDTELLLTSLQQAGIIDAERVAVVGHSHGGALSYYYLTHSKSFCAVTPVNGWSDWSEIAERVGGSETERPAILQRASPILNAAGVNAPLLAVSGATDTQVLPHNASRMVETLKAIGKPAELLHFPDEGHLIEKPVNRVTFWQKVVSFLEANCR